MTREEAIDILQGAIKKPNTKDGYLGQAIDMAIKALEQEPCEDAISRQAVIDVIERWLECSDYNEAERHIMRAVQSVLYDSPSVTPQPKTGHWIGIDEEPHEDYECDKCGYIVSTFTANIEPHTEYKYCPNCGARMES